MKKIVILDIGYNTLGENKIFNPKFAYPISHTLLPLCFLVEEAKKTGIDFITPDIFLRDPESFSEYRVLLISQLTNTDTEKLLRFGAEPFLLLCLESPFIATRFYATLKKHTSLFKHSWLFIGMKSKVSKNTEFSAIFFPQFFTNKIFPQIPFKEKKLLAYIASNKEISGVLKIIVIKLLYGFEIKSLYSFRRKLLHHLSLKNNFDLYGKGWGEEKDYRIKKVYRGEVLHKVETLRKYKFTLCLENSVFPGYTTEKIFDAFFALSIPVYLGDPHISLSVPQNTFIDINNFKNLDELEDFLTSMCEQDYNKYIENIKLFLSSDAYKKFSHQEFAKKVISLIKTAE